MNKANIKAILSQKGLDKNTEFWCQRLEEVSVADVERALSETAGVYSFDKLIALLSPTAEDYLEQMAQLARQLTLQRFGRTIKLYVPLYLSNYCTNSCLYCGFNRQSNFKRTRLTVEDAVKEAEILANQGFSDLLLVSSEDSKFISIDYLAELVESQSKFENFMSVRPKRNRLLNHHSPQFFLY